MLRKYFVTFGTDKKFPFPSQYMVVYAEREAEVYRYLINKYRPGSDCAPCSFVYDADDEEMVLSMYKQAKPATIVFIGNGTQEEVMEAFNIYDGQEVTLKGQDKEDLIGVVDTFSEESFYFEETTAFGDVVIIRYEEVVEITPLKK